MFASRTLITLTYHTIIRAAFVCVFVCLFVPYVLRGPLTDLRQTWWVYVGWPPICPWGVLFRKGQRVDGSTAHFRFPLYYICTSLMPHAATAPFAFVPAAESNSAPFVRRVLHCISTVYVGGPWGILFLKGQRVDRSTGQWVNGSTAHISTVYVGGPRNCPWGLLFRKGQQVDGSTSQTDRRVNGSLSLSLYYIW